jgi:short-subunit dehydrogenase
MPTALVTGPTSGLGRGFAEAFARKGFDLVLVSRDGARLEQVSAELLAACGVRSEVLPADLSVRSDVDRVARRLADASAPVSALVNNAGFALSRSFLSDDIDDEQRLIDVHVVAVMRLTHAALPGMIGRGHGMVVNVSSIAGWITGGTYSAAKSWVTVFSESLAQQLEGTGVRITAACPGFVHTEFHERASIDMSQLPSVMWLDVPQVVDQAFRDLATNNPVSVTGLQYKVASSALRNGPRSIARFATGMRGRNPRFGKRD